MPKFRVDGDRRTGKNTPRIHSLELFKHTIRVFNEAMFSACFLKHGQAYE